MKKDEKNDQSFRLLELYHMVIQGEPLQKQQLAEKYQVSEKTIQRDIECLRAFFQQHAGSVICYRRRENHYILETNENKQDESAEMVVRIGRILYESGKAEEAEYRSMMEWLLLQTAPKDRYAVLKKIQMK